jgi:hypothetical protein
MVRSVHKVARYAKIHIRYNILIPYLENYDIRQPYDPRGAGYCNFYCTSNSFILSKPQEMLFSVTEFVSFSIISVRNFQKGCNKSFHGVTFQFNEFI